LLRGGDFTLLAAGGSLRGYGNLGATVSFEPFGNGRARRLFRLEKRPLNGGV
jgi:hypothetical protein